MNNVMECQWVVHGLSLGPVLANIIMMELENVIVRNLLADGTVAFYARFS